MFDFRRITLFCLEKCLSKHKMTVFSENLGVAMVPLDPRGYAYGTCNIARTFQRLTQWFGARGIAPPYPPRYASGLIIMLMANFGLNALQTLCELLHILIIYHVASMATPIKIFLHGG